MAVSDLRNVWEMVPASTETLSFTTRHTNAKGVPKVQWRFLTLTANAVTRVARNDSADCAR